MKVLTENKKRLVEEEEVEVDVEMTSTGDEAKPATKEDALIIKNALTDILDDAFADCKDPDVENCNVLITGLPGSSKTQTVKAWCAQNGCNFYYLDAKNPDLATLLSGSFSLDKADEAHPKIRQAFSSIYEKLQQPNLVLFLDELNRQVRASIRGSLLSLIADKEIQGDTPSGFIKINDLLFTVACCNPKQDPKDYSVEELNSAEIRRFYYQIHFDSTADSTNAYLDANYDTKLKNLAKHPEDPKFDEKVRIYILSQYIGKCLIADRRFDFSKLDDYKASFKTHDKIVTQSTITELISHSHGDINRMIRDIKRSGHSEKDINNIIEILESITLPDYISLLKRKERELGIDLGSSKFGKGGAATDELADKMSDGSIKVGDDDDELDFSGPDDDDDDFVFSGATGKHAEEAKISDAEAKSRIMGTLDSILGGF